MFVFVSKKTQGEAVTSQSLIVLMSEYNWALLCCSIVTCSFGDKPQNLIRPKCPVASSYAYPILYVEYAAIVYVGWSVAMLESLSVAVIYRIIDTISEHCVYKIFENLVNACSLQD